MYTTSQRGTSWKPLSSRDGKFGTRTLRGASVGRFVIFSFSGSNTAIALQHKMVWYGMVNVDLCSAIIAKVSNALNTLVSEEQPGFQALSKGLVVLLCAEVVRQGVPDHGAVHSECSASNSG